MIERGPGRPLETMEEHQWTELAVAVRRGDRDGFRDLVESATRTLIALAWRYTRDWETARDLTQDTWIKVHRAIESYDTVRSFRAWIYTVHRNTCLSYLRTAAVRREVVTPPDEMAEQLPSATGATTPDPAERREFMERLDRALAQLSTGQRNVFTRVYIEHLTQKEAAEALGMSFATLRTTLHFARKRLAGILGRMEDTA